jgi:hypothetical protein
MASPLSLSIHSNRHLPFRPMAQLLFTTTDLTASPSLERALQLVEARLANWASSTTSDAYNALLLQIFGAQSSEPTTAIQLASPALV